MLGNVGVAEGIAREVPQCVATLHGVGRRNVGAERRPGLGGAAGPAGQREDGDGNRPAETGESSRSRLRRQRAGRMGTTGYPLPALKGCWNDDRSPDEKRPMRDNSHLSGIGNRDWRSSMPDPDPGPHSQQVLGRPRLIQACMSACAAFGDRHPAATVQNRLDAHRDGSPCIPVAHPLGCVAACELTRTANRVPRARSASPLARCPYAA